MRRTRRYKGHFCGATFSSTAARRVGLKQSWSEILLHPTKCQMFNSLEHVEHIQELEKRCSLDFKSVMGRFRDYLCGVNMMLNNFEMSIRFYPLNGPLQWE